MGTNLSQNCCTTQLNFCRTSCDNLLYELTYKLSNSHSKVMPKSHNCHPTVINKSSEKAPKSNPIVIQSKSHAEIMQKSPNSKEQSTEKIYKRLTKSNPQGTQESRKYGLAQKSCRSHPHVIPKSSKSHPKVMLQDFKRLPNNTPRVT